MEDSSPYTTQICDNLDCHSYETTGSWNGWIPPKISHCSCRYHGHQQLLWQREAVDFLRLATPNTETLEFSSHTPSATVSPTYSLEGHHQGQHAEAVCCTRRTSLLDEILYANYVASEHSIGTFHGISCLQESIMPPLVIDPTVACPLPTTFTPTSRAEDIPEPLYTVQDDFPDTASVTSAASFGSLSNDMHGIQAAMFCEPPQVLDSFGESNAKPCIHDDLQQLRATSQDQPKRPQKRAGKHQVNNDPHDCIFPSDFDVLCGKGGKTIEHNRHFILLCSQFTEAFKTKGRGVNGKKGLALNIVRVIHGKDGRFLKPKDTGLGWTAISDDEAAKKVAHCLRDLARSKKS
jgi:hypothetical protein